MKRFLRLAAVTSFAIATGAHAQGGPVNHGAAAATAARAPEEADAMAPPPPRPAQDASDVGSMLGQVRSTVQADLDQHKLSRRKARHLRRELDAIEARADVLSRRLSGIAASLP